MAYKQEEKMGDGQPSREQILRILQEKDHYKFSVEISENAKGEPQVTVKTHSEDDVEEAGIQALKEYNRIRKELGR